MGRTANTREGISKDRAHVHFELDLLVNEGFPGWYKQKFPGQRNDHAGWNGRNLIGLDPRLILLEEQRLGPKFSLVEHIRRQTELCRVVVRDEKFPWLERYKGLVRPNPLVDKEGIAGYELALNYNGLIFELIPRASSEIKGKARIQLLSVNAAEQQKNPARHLVTRKRAGWELTHRGTELMELLVY